MDSMRNHASTYIYFRKFQKHRHHTCSSLEFPAEINKEAVKHQQLFYYFSHKLYIKEEIIDY